jgi:hypothetical protein
LDHAVFLWNNLPNDSSSLAPIELFTRSRFPNYHHLRRLHVWGCPAYVLDPNLQDGKKIPKWAPRSRRGKFLGISPTHSSTIGLILNLRTGHVSPQYHVVYDDEFTTVPNAESGGLFNAERPFDAAQWQQLVEAGTERVIVDDDAVLPPLHRDWEPPPPPQFLLPIAPPCAPAVTDPEGENGEVLAPTLGPAPVVTPDPQPLPAPEGVEFDAFEPDLPPPEPDPVQHQQQQPTVTRSGRFV